MTENSEHNRGGSKMESLLVVSTSAELAEYFTQEICGPLLEGADGLRLDGLRVKLSTLTGKPEEQSDWKPRISAVNALIILVEHVDTLSLEDLKNIYNSVPSHTSSAPIAFFVVREPNKKEFKVSCLKCGQKIRLRDEYVGRSCTCPNCRKPFTIVSQKMTLRQQLRLPQDMQVEQVDGVNREFTRGALERLAERITPGAPIAPPLSGDALKHTTMRIDLPDLSKP